MFSTFKVLVTIMVLAGVFLMPGGAAADFTMTISDNTWMQPWQGSDPATAGTGWGNWTATPVAGAQDPPSAWEVNKVTISWSGKSLEMQIFTNYPNGAGIDNAGQTDIALSRGGGNFDVGIDLRSTQGTIGGIYSVGSWKTPQDFWAASGWIYAGRYDTLDSSTGKLSGNVRVPNTVIGTVNLKMGQATVNFGSAPSGSGSSYMWDIVFPDQFNADGSWNRFDFTLGSGSCGNDFFAGSADDPPANSSGNNQAPIPASVLLFGSGLVGLGLLTLKKKVAGARQGLARREQDQQ